jgi:hypothetical protein
MILFFLICLLIFIIFSNNELFIDQNNLSIINEIVTKKNCFYNNNELLIGKKYIQKLSDNKFYNVCEYNLDKNNDCSAPCLLFDPKCNTTIEPVILTKDKDGVLKCRTQSKLI